MFILLFGIGPTGVFSQPDYTTKNKKAIKYYEEAIVSYNKTDRANAMDLLLKAIKKDDSFLEAHTMLGYVYSDLNLPQKAIEQIKKTIELNPDFHWGNYFSLAQLQIITGNYREAKENYLKFLERPSDNQDMNKTAELKINSCSFAMASIENPVPFKPVNLGEGVNSKYDEYFPTITADEQMFLFTRKIPDGKNQNGWQEDFYVSDKINGKWGRSYSIGPKINTEGNEGAPCLSADGQILFFTACENDFGYGAGRQGFGSCDIFYSFRDGNDWTKPVNIGPPVCTKWWETQPSFSSDGKTLYFIRGVTDAKGKKQTDIWTSVLKENGKWTNPVKLSDKINTPYNEESVFIHPDNQTLYFSSDGHPGMGGMDIFVSRRQPNGEWGEPVNLGYPINTMGDENSFLVSRDGKTAYFASDRKGGYGGLDIYSFDLYEAARPGKTIYVKGTVFDAVTKLPLEADIEVIELSEMGGDPQNGNSVMKSISNKKNGEFLICLPVNKNYAFNTSKTGYLFHSENFALTENKEYKPFTLNMPLSPITKDSTVILKNIFFETNKYYLKDESKTELNKLTGFLNKNETLKIELSGHTDDVGDKKSNQILSQNRAKSIYEYLIANGIAKERLSYKGYGDTKPVVANDSDEHRQMNRRTEFKVIEK